MNNNASYNSGDLIYPGEYIPLFKENNFSGYVAGNKKNIFPVNIEELGSCYKIELSVPGAKRENFLINSYGNVVSVSVIHDDCELVNQESFQLREFNYAGCFNRKIVLPDNADFLFVSAEYKSGILRLYVPKSNHPLKWINTKIAIY